MGRPTKPPTPGERVPLSLRVTAEIKERLEKAAVEKGRSLSQEAELRIERSFDREELLPEVLTLFYGKPVADVLIERRSQLVKIDSSRLKRMIDPDLFASMYDGWKRILGEAGDRPIKGTPTTYEPGTLKLMFQQLEKFFGEGEEETVGTDPRSGKRQTRYVTVRGKRQDAERALARLLIEAHNGTLIEPSKVTVAEHIRTWLNKAHELSPKTAERYRQLAEQQIIPHLGAVQLQKLKPSQVRIGTALS